MTYTEQIAQTNIDLAKQKGIYDLIMEAASFRTYGISKWEEADTRKRELLAFSEAFAATDFTREGKSGTLSEKGNGLINILNFHVDADKRMLTGMNTDPFVPSFVLRHENDLLYVKLWQEAGYQFVGNSVFAGTI